jgi:hypothetical protein
LIILILVIQWTVHSFYNTGKIVPTHDGLKWKLASCIGFTGRQTSQKIICRIWDLGGENLKWACRF